MTVKFMVGILRYFFLELQRSILNIRMFKVAKCLLGCSLSLQSIMQSASLISLKYYFQDTSCPLIPHCSGIRFLNLLFLGHLLHKTTGIYSSLCGARILHHSSSTMETHRRLDKEHLSTSSSTF